MKGPAVTSDIMEAIAAAYGRGDKYTDIAASVGRPVHTVNTVIRHLRARGVVGRRYEQWIEPRPAPPKRCKKRLSPQQARILKVLHENRGNVVPREVLIATAEAKTNRPIGAVYVVIAKIKARFPGIRIEAVHERGYVLHA